MQNILENAAISDLLRAEKVALKYSPCFALMISKEYQKRISQ